MSELDAGGFGDLLCGLAAEKLAGLEALGQLDSDARAVPGDLDSLRSASN